MINCKLVDDDRCSMVNCYLADDDRCSMVNSYDDIVNLVKMITNDIPR